MAEATQVDVIGGDVKMETAVKEEVNGDDVKMETAVKEEVKGDDVKMETAVKEEVNGDDVKMETAVKEEVNGDEKPSLKRPSEESDENGEKKVKKEVMDEDEVKLGPKTFGTSVEMFAYFFKLLHFWPQNLNLNKYEQLVLLDLLKKGHAEADRKIGVGIKSFQVRYHPMWKSRCFFLIREDESSDDFSFRKCVDRILPLPENMKGRPEVNKAFGGRGGGGYRGRGRGGRGAKQRN